MIEASVSLQELLKENLLKKKAVFVLYDLLVEHMRMYNRKERDDLWTGVIRLCLEYATPRECIETYIPQALDYVDK